MRKRLLIALSLLLLGITLIGGCKGADMKTAEAKMGDTVKIDYTGTLEDGSQFDSSKGRDPLEFTIGFGQVIPGFENAVVGMKPGESKTVKIPAAEAYGEYRDELVFKVGKDQLPPDIKPEIGQELTMRGNNQTVQVKIIAVDDTEVTMDANHPLAGKNLTFEIKFVEIEPPAKT
jgi:peptidylprolyl isomerase